MNLLFTNFFKYAAAHRKQIITGFKVWYAILLSIVAVGVYSELVQNDFSNFFYIQGINIGRLAVVFFVLVLLPGIFRRFKWQHPLVQTIMLFRRYMGISVFLLGFSHFLLVRFIPRIAYNLDFLPLMTFEIMSAIALLLLFVMFLTSNDYSVRMLGKGWNTLHKVVYIVVWLLFAHTALQRWSLASIALGIAAVLEVISLVYFYMQKKSTPPPSSTPLPSTLQPTSPQIQQPVQNNLDTNREN